MYAKLYGEDKDLLTEEEINLIESTELSSIDKHYLRLIAYCLASFKKMENISTTGSLPIEQNRLDWLLTKFALKDDDPFIAALLKQFDTAANRLEQIADFYKISPLEMNLLNLIDFHVMEFKKQL